MSKTPTLFIACGATGDLMARKIIPALFELFTHNMLPENFYVLGFSRRNWSNEDFQEYIRSLFPQDQNAHTFSKRFMYQQGQFTEEKDFESLAERIQDIDKEFGVQSNKIVYLSVSPEFYKTFLHSFLETKLKDIFQETRNWTRLLIEKPFGYDQESSRELNTLLHRVFNESHIYRIDHYLAKDALEDMYALRFKEGTYENIWNSTYIDHIEIKLLETLDVSNRADFYDTVGALRDVGQNHMLEMLALTTMEKPKDSSDIRKKRAEILNHMHIYEAERKQYREYREHEEARSDSTTETYFNIKATLQTPRWSGVPIYLEAGKRMPKAEKEIVVYFKESSTSTPECITCRLEPNQGLYIQDGHSTEYLSLTPAVYKNEYSKLIHYALNGDQSLFIDGSEIEAAWALVDPILTQWKKETSLQLY